LLEWAIRKFQEFHEQPILVPGQHDLPNHRLNDYSKSGCGVLEAAEVIIESGDVFTITSENLTIRSFPFGKEISRSNSIEGTLIAVAHQMVIENKPLWPGQEAPRGHELLKKFPEYDLILTGDNHLTFVQEYEGRYLVNPGSMMRMTIDQMDHKPCVFLWYGPGVPPERIFLPAGRNVWDESNQVQTSRQERTSRYVEALMGEYEVALSFTKTLENFYRKNRIRQTIKDKIAGAMPK
jgi:predicted phosphodiesterase